MLDFSFRTLLVTSLLFFSYLVCRALSFSRSINLIPSLYFIGFITGMHLCIADYNLRMKLGCAGYLA